MPSLNLHPSTITIYRTKPSIPRHTFGTSSSHHRDSYTRSDFQSQGASFTSSYDPNEPTRGPLSQASKHGATPRLTPTLLKEHLDKFVVGQDKAKKVVSVAVFNHYQRIREIRRQNEEERARKERVLRWELKERERRSHPVESTALTQSHIFSCFV
jgi:ATP-dependent Clp protease ATP-binding subunit ClpX